MPYFSVIVPVYNRIDEVRDLLASLAKQSMQNFEVLIVEDGSTEPCREVVESFADSVDVKYFYKENEGRSIARNYGIERAGGKYFIFFDSDCVIPAQYFKTLTERLNEHYVPCFGGPDAAHESFSDVQKAINFSMTAFLTTGGIRGGKMRDLTSASFAKHLSITSAVSTCRNFRVRPMCLACRASRSSCCTPIRSSWCTACRRCSLWA